MDCAVRFFVSLYKSDEGIPAYFKEDLCKMKESMQAARKAVRRSLCGIALSKLLFCSVESRVEHDVSAFILNQTF